jgi:predicted amidohydrolase
MAGDVSANLEKITALAASACRVGTNLVVFPECATTGYFVGRISPRLWDLAAIVRENRLARRQAAAGIRERLTKQTSPCLRVCGRLPV